MKHEHYDRAVVGGGLFGLYAAGLMASRGHTVVVIEAETTPLMRASLVNQARLHMGYHYPRSTYTAVQTARYYERFQEEFPESVRSDFQKIYAIGTTGSRTDAAAFEQFCGTVNIPLQRIDHRRFFNPRAVEAAYLTRETAFDVAALRATLLKRMADTGRATLHLGRRVAGGDLSGSSWRLTLADWTTISADGIVNATYASTNEVLRAFGFDPIDLKYELCEVVLVRPNAGLESLGITVLDGPFFSVMPFGHGELHSLTAPSLTPRVTSYGNLPSFACQQRRQDCQPARLAGCASCPERPASAFPLFDQLARKYLVPSLDYEYVESLFAVKAVFTAAELDDARPTLIVRNNEDPPFTTVFSGKVSTVFDLDDIEL